MNFYCADNCFFIYSYAFRGQHTKHKPLPFLARRFNFSYNFFYIFLFLNNILIELISKQLMIHNWKEPLCVVCLDMSIFPKAIVLA